MSLAPFLALAVAASGSPGLADLRAHRDEVDGQQSALSARVGEEQRQLDGVAKRIDELKAQRQGSDSPFVSGSLDALLKQSQALSQSLAELRAQSAQLRALQDQARSDLAAGLDARLTADRGVLGSTGASPEVVAEIRSLEAERAALQPSAGPGASAPAVRFSGHTDDPRELRERADALRDRADKLTKEQARVEARIQELRDQAELDHQLRSISRQDALFDEGDVRIQPGHAGGLDSPAADDVKGTGAAAPAATPSPPSRRSPLYTGSSLHVPPFVTAPEDVPAQDTGAFNGVTMSRTPSDPSQGGIDPPTHSGPTTDSTGSGSNTSAVDGVSSTPAGQVVRPDDFGTRPDAAPVSLDDSSLDDLQAAQARLTKQASELRQQATALDQQAAHAQ